jgi:sialate O-acetylesterase
VKKGKAVISIRVTDTGGGGGIYGDEAKIFLASDEAGKISLSGEWKYKQAVNFREFPSPQSIRNPNRPTVLYNAMIHPLIPYAMQGAIWYQGESNADRAYQYRELFPLMIRDWRKAWNRDFPFYFVQLANYMERKNEPQESDWAKLREAQLQTLNLENTGMAVIIDIGDAKDIHPKNKQEVGRRLALAAEANTYKQKNDFSGPIYRGYKIEGNKIKLSFNYAEGLKSNDGKALTGFAIAGPDHVFHWANAVIEGSEVVVNSPEIKFPVAVRYAWANNPECNLHNGANLPASPFRTDDWQ